jgi:hypothetical protein
MKGLIDNLLNLECAKTHHRHFSPTPEAWVGQECRTIIGEGRNPQKCMNKLRRIRGRSK